MTMEVIGGRFTVCQIEDLHGIDLTQPFAFFARTDEELSLVCPEEKAPVKTLRREDGWRAVRVQGTLDFALVGILAEISQMLAVEGISIFAVSTYNTDYVLVKEDRLEHALRAIRRAGYEIAGE